MDNTFITITEEHEKQARTIREQKQFFTYKHKQQIKSTIGNTGSLKDSVSAKFSYVPTIKFTLTEPYIHPVQTSKLTLQSNLLTLMHF
jgi:hypothetical protein